MGEKIPKEGREDLFEPRIEHSVGPEQVDIEIKKDVEEIPNEKTPSEWREKLRTLITSEGDVLKNNVEEAKELFVQEKAYLTARSKEFGEKIKNFDPKIEEGFRLLGEKYNKLGWKSKLAVGASLGLGAAAFSTVSMPIAFACMSGIAAQRIAGMAGMFLKFEKNKKIEGFSEERKKQAAILMAAGYSIGFGAAISEAVHLASESSVGAATHEWLKQHWPFGSAENVENPVAQKTAPSEYKESVIPSETSQPAAAGESVATNAVSEAAPEIPAPEIPEISINASPGRGYEYMIKRLWEQLHEKNIALSSNIDPRSDFAKLMEADATTIDKIVHQIASDPEHGFFKADGTSVQINPSDHISIGADGQINLNGEVHAPKGAPITPAYHLEASVAPHVETSTPETETSITPEANTSETSTASQESPAQKLEPSDTLPTGVVEDEKTREWLDKHYKIGPPPESSRGISAESPSVVQESIVNKFGLEVPKNIPHIYADHNAEHLLAYGGSRDEQAKAIQNYLTGHPKDAVYGASADGTSRVKYFLNSEGGVVADLPIKKSFLERLFSGMFADIPQPEEFEKLIT